MISLGLRIFGFLKIFLQIYNFPGLPHHPNIGGNSMNNEWVFNVGQP
jgi:hypothetical protein